MRVEFIKEYPLDKLQPADYNPRFLPEDKFKKLQESLKLFGVIKPVIVNGDNGVLTAGHQRTRAMKSIGLKTTPCIRIKNIKIQDEIRFNLFHNSIETSKSVVKITQDLKPGYNIIKHENIVLGKNENAMIIKSIGDLILKYGEWGSVICDENGLVLINNDYAYASKQLKHDVICYVVENSKVQSVFDFLKEDYGEYHYESLKIKSHNQLYAQMYRMPSGGKNKLSSTYENYVIPRLNKTIRILDFGAGKCEYVKMLSKQGYHIVAYEPFYQGNNHNINIKMVVKMINNLEKEVAENGLFDMVVLDSVINSVVNNDFENYVVTTCNAFLKSDGVFITGTRNLGSVTNKLTMNLSTSKKRWLEFLDKDNYTATFRQGVWTMQHFHDFDSLRKLMSRYFGEVSISGTNTGGNIYAVCKKPLNLDYDQYKTALNIELNMEYPNGYRHNEHKQLVKLLLESLERRGANDKKRGTT